MRELEKAAGNYKNIKKDYDLRMCFTKWLFIAKIRSIKSLTTFEEKSVAAMETEKNLHDREFRI